MRAWLWLVYQAFGASLNWVQERGYSYADLHLPANGKSGFALLSPEVPGSRWTNTLSDQHLMEYQICQVCPCATPFSSSLAAGSEKPFADFFLQLIEFPAQLHSPVRGRLRRKNSLSRTTRDEWSIPYSVRALGFLLRLLHGVIRETASGTAFEICAACGAEK